MKNRGKKILCAMIAFSMVVVMLPQQAFANAIGEGLTQSKFILEFTNPEQWAEQNYVVGDDTALTLPETLTAKLDTASSTELKQDCAHHVHDEDCAYTEAVLGTACDKACTVTDAHGIVQHSDDCAYKEEVLGSACTFDSSNCEECRAQSASMTEVEIEVPVKWVEKDSKEFSSTKEDVFTFNAELANDSEYTLKSDLAMPAIVVTPSGITEENGVAEASIAQISDTAIAEDSWVPYAKDIDASAEGDQYFSGGNGTEYSPFQIASAQELANLSYITNTNQSNPYNGNQPYAIGYYEITDDIVLNRGLEFTYQPEDTMVRVTGGVVPSI